MKKTFIAIVAAAMLPAGAAHAQSLGYGFTHPSYSYDQEYRENQWKCSEAHRYQPGYHRSGGDEMRRDADEEDQE